jgi:hypothetical protein
MKTFLFLIICSLSSPAFSMHNYFQETCAFDSSKGEIKLYKRDYWEGYHSIITSDIEGLDDYQEVFLPGNEGSGDDKVRGDEAMVFTNVSDKNLVKEPYDDGCWQGFNASFDRTVKVKTLKKDVQGILKINPGDALSMKCSYEHLVISGEHCDDL